MLPYCFAVGVGFIHVYLPIWNESAFLGVLFLLDTFLALMYIIIMMTPLHCVCTLGTAETASECGSSETGQHGQTDQAAIKEYPGQSPIVHRNQTIQSYYDVI